MALSERSNRHDWMLLLPATVTLPTEDVIVVGGTDVMAQSLVDRGVARSWRRPSGPFDMSMLIVGWADARDSVAEMARLVAPGGVLVIEIERRRLGRRLLSARAVGRRLRRAGMNAHSFHVVEPSFARPGRYLPVDAPRALRWYLRTLFIAGSPVMKIASAAMSAVATTPLAQPSVGASGSRLLVIATAAGGSVPDARGSSSQPAPLGAPDGRDGDRAIVLTSGYDAGSRAVMVLFGADERVPREVVKIASGSDNAEATVNEHTRLGELHRSLPRPLASALPMPLLASSVAGRVACVQTCAPGPSMSSLVGAWALRRGPNRARLEVVTEWLTDLALATRIHSPAGPASWLGVLADLRTTVPLSSSVVQLLHTAERVAMESGLAAQEVHQHYDTGPWNIHLGRRGPFVVDWEHDRMRPADCLGPPLADTLYFATYWYFLTQRAQTAAEEEQALVRLFAEPMALDHDVLAARYAIDVALEALGLPRRSVPAALVVLWAERALYTFRRRSAQGVAVELAELRPLAFLLALAEAPGLFGAPGWWSLPAGSNVATDTLHDTPEAHPGRPASLGPEVHRGS